MTISKKVRQPPHILGQGETKGGVELHRMEKKRSKLQYLLAAGLLRHCKMKKGIITKKKSPRVGLEPTTSGLEVRRATIAPTGQDFGC